MSKLAPTEFDYAQAEHAIADWVRNWQLASDAQYCCGQCSYKFSALELRNKNFVEFVGITPYHRHQEPCMRQVASIAIQGQRLAALAHRAVSKCVTNDLFDKRINALGAEQDIARERIAAQLNTQLNHLSAELAQLGQVTAKLESRITDVGRAAMNDDAGVEGRLKHICHGLQTQLNELASQLEVRKRKSK